MKIPKIIHLIWIGDDDIPELYKSCISTWSLYAQDYEIITWGNNNLPKGDPFIERLVKQKKYAFLSDYLRCKILYEYGGIYLDADMELIANIDDLLVNECFLGYESEGRVANGIMGAIPKHWFVDELSKKIENSPNLKAIPLHTTELLIKHGLKNGDRIVKNITIYPEEYFYPYNPFDKTKSIKQLMYKDITPNTIAIHHWAKSWEIKITDKIIGKIKGIMK